MNLEEIEDIHKSLRICPECKSTEGFWLITKRDATFFQCKHCAAILEASRIYATRKEPKDYKLVIKLRR